MQTNMTNLCRRAIALITVVFFLTATGFSSAYNHRPKLVVLIVVDQFRADYLEQLRDQFGPGGFRLLMERGANFTDCYYDYAATRTAPGHATLATGAYTDGHGIIGNEWWDPARNKVVESVDDKDTKIVGLEGSPREGASPHYLLADSFSDELRLATGGRSRAFGISLKDRAAILPTGFSGNGAYWIDRASGAFVTSTYYMKQLPKWAAEFNASRRADKYWNLEWKDSSGKVIRATASQKSQDGKSTSFYDVVGPTPFATEYELEFARELVSNENLGGGETTDVLTISISAYDILGHKVGPNSPEMAAMALALDRQLAEFFAFLGRQIGLANVWIALSADHGIAPLPEFAQTLHVPASRIDERALPAQLNTALNAKLSPGKNVTYVTAVRWPIAYLSEEAFTAVNLKEADAEQVAGETFMAVAGLRGFYTKTTLASGQIPRTEMGMRFAHSYSPHGGWYTFGIPAAFVVPYPTGTDHYSPYNYDAHVPLLLFGLPFQPGVYRTHAEPVDLAVTLTSLLGINRPSHAQGRVLTEALAPPQTVNTERAREKRAPTEGARLTPEKAE